MSDALTPYERKRVEDFRMLRKLAARPPEYITSEDAKALLSTIGFLCGIIDRLAPPPEGVTSGANRE